MKCLVCKKKLDKKKQHRFTVVRIQYDNILEINRLQSDKNKYMHQRPMHNECAKTYKLAEKVMISAGIIKEKPQFATFGSNAKFTIYGREIEQEIFHFHYGA